MSTLTANELKIRGVTALEESLKDGGEALISVRGKHRYVVMDIEKYNKLREFELAAAVAEARADYNAGRYTTETVAEHIEKVTT